MCNRPDNLTSEFDSREAVVILLPKVWPMLMVRHGTCLPSEECVIDACLRTTSGPVTSEEIDDNYAKDLVADAPPSDECTHWKFPGSECRHDKADPVLPGEPHEHNFDRMHGFCRCGHLRTQR